MKLFSIRVKELLAIILVSSFAQKKKKKKKKRQQVFAIFNGIFF